MGCQPLSSGQISNEGLEGSCTASFGSAAGAVEQSSRAPIRKQVVEVRARDKITAHMFATYLSKGKESGAVNVTRARHCISTPPYHTLSSMPPTKRTAKGPTSFSALTWSFPVRMAGEEGIEEKRCALDVRVEETIDCGSYERRLITYASEPGARVPAYLLIPKAALESRRKLPAVL